MFIWIFSWLSVIERKISAFNKTFSPVLTELVSTCRKKNIEAKYFFKKRVSYIFFRTSIELFSAFCRNFSDEVVKAAFYVSIATFWKNNAEKFQMLRRKPSAFCDKLFDSVVKTAFQVYMGTSWAEKLSDENVTFSCSDIERKAFTFVRKFFNWVAKTAFFVSRSVLCVEHLLQESCRVVYHFQTFRQKIFAFWQKNNAMFFKSVQNCILTVNWNNSRKGFLRKSYLVIFRALAKNLRFILE